MKEIADIKIPPIRNGTVIDHIENGQALNVLKILGVNENNIDSGISIGMHVPTTKETKKWKDIVKLEDMELDETTVSKIALIAPDATISIIRDYYGRQSRGARQMQQSQLHNQQRRTRIAPVLRGGQASSAAEMRLLRPRPHEHIGQSDLIA